MKLTKKLTSTINTLDYNSTREILIDASNKSLQAMLNNNSKNEKHYDSIVSSCNARLLAITGIKKASTILINSKEYKVYDITNNVIYLTASTYIDFSNMTLNSNMKTLAKNISIENITESKKRIPVETKVTNSTEFVAGDILTTTHSRDVTFLYECKGGIMAEYKNSRMILSKKSIIGVK